LVSGSLKEKAGPFPRALCKFSLYCRCTGKRWLLNFSKFQPQLVAWLLISAPGTLAVRIVVKQNCLAGIVFWQTIYTSV